jgi:transcriptional regulator with XRE-family HTH domain
MNEIQEKIQALRSKGWTLAAIADELGNSWRAVAYWQEGTRQPANAKLVSNALDALKRKRVPKQRRYEPGSRAKKS